MNDQVRQALIIMFSVALVGSGYLYARNSTLPAWEKSRFASAFQEKFFPEYGFSLKIPNDPIWSRLTMDTTSDGVDFRLPTQDNNWNNLDKFDASVFTIGAFPKDKLPLLKQSCSFGEFGFMECLPLSSPLTENDKYIFYFERADRVTDYPQDFSVELFDQGENISKTIRIY